MVTTTQVMMIKSILLDVCCLVLLYQLLFISTIIVVGDSISFECRLYI